VKTVLPSRLCRQRFSAWAVLLIRSFATVGLFLAAVVAATSSRGLISLAFLTGTSVTAVAAIRARRTTRWIGAAVRLQKKVGQVLDPLAAGGWYLKHNVRWPEGPGEGHLVMNPTGQLAFAVKDCAAAIADFDLTQTQDFASALSQTGRPYIPICVGPAGDKRLFADRGVICCTPELLVGELIEAEQAFATSLMDEAARRHLLYSQSSLN
jgi:hypothetical protein